MSLDGQSLLQGLSEFLEDWHVSSTTSAGNASKTTFVDTALGIFGDKRLSGRYVRIVEGTTNLYDVGKVTGNTQSTGTVTVSPPFGAQVASDISYELHKYEPAKKFLALDKARLELVDRVYRLVLDDTITSDGRTNVYDIPTLVEQGPMLAYCEEPIACDVEWNFLSTPLLDGSTGWSTANAVRSTVEQTPTDLLIPKYDLNCTRLAVAASTNGTYAQTVANMRNGITAAVGAGRKMTFAKWVYALEGARVALELTDDSGTSTGPFHGGRGWELLWVERTIAANNATTLTVTLDVASGTNPLVVYLNRAWFYFGNKERVVDAIFNTEKPIVVRRDAAQQHVVLGDVPSRGRQVRLQGKAPLSALGTDPLTQGSNLMEVDEKTAEVLYAYAADILLGWERLTTDNVPEVSARIAAVKARMPALERAWSQPAPSPHLPNPFGY